MRLRWPLVVLALCVAGAGCKAEPSASDTGAAVPSAESQPVDPVLLAFLSHARAAHHRADAFEAQSELDQAIAELVRVTDGPRPTGGYAEMREVLADTHARLADLRSRQGQFDSAEEEVATGLTLAEDRTYFRGHLFEVRGLLEERRSRALSSEGQTEAADAAKQRALEAFEQAMDIQAHVIQKALAEEPAR